MEGKKMDILNVSKSIGMANSASGALDKKSTMPVNSLGKTFEDLLNELNSTQIESDNLIKKASAGEDVDVHDLMIAMDKTDVEFKVAIAIRDRLVDAYREVMRMSV